MEDFFSKFSSKYLSDCFGCNNLAESLSLSKYISEKSKETFDYDDFFRERKEGNIKSVPICKDLFNSEGTLKLLKEINRRHDFFIDNYYLALSILKVYPLGYFSRLEISEICNSIYIRNDFLHPSIHILMKF